MADVTIYNLPFTCVKLSEADFSDFAAIYVILCVSVGGKWKVLDVGQSREVGTRINSHDRENCWNQNCQSGSIWVCLYKTPSTSYTKEQRSVLEKEIRDFYNPVCGKR
jgi:hypothetical protein